MNEKERKQQRNHELAAIIKNTYGKPELRNEYNAACEEFLKSYSGLVHSYAIKYKTNNKKLIYEDLVIHFQNSLIAACNSYNEAKKLNVTTYLIKALDFASFAFHHEDITQNGKSTAHVFNKINYAYAYLTNNNKPTTVKNLAEISKCSEESVYGYLNFNKIAYLDAPIKDNKYKDRVLADTIIQENSLEDLAIESVDAENLQLALKFLPKKLAIIIYLTFYKEKNQTEIAEIFNFSQSFTCRQIKKAIKILRILNTEENLMCIKHIFNLKEKNKKLTNNNIPVTLNNLLKDENISPKQLYRIYYLSRFKHSNSEVSLNKTMFDKEPCNLLNLGEEYKNLLKDIIILPSKKELVDKYPMEPFTFMDCGILKLIRQEAKSNKCKKQYKKQLT